MGGRAEFFGQIIAIALCLVVALLMFQLMMVVVRPDRKNKKNRSAKIPGGSREEAQAIQDRIRHRLEQEDAQRGVSRS